MKSPRLGGNAINTGASGPRVLLWKSAAGKFTHAPQGGLWWPRGQVEEGGGELKHWESFLANSW